MHRIWQIKIKQSFPFEMKSLFEQDFSRFVGSIYTSKRGRSLADGT